MDAVKERQPRNPQHGNDVVEQHLAAAIRLAVFIGPASASIISLVRANAQRLESKHPNLARYD
ncbi:hypothetical protein LY78DRAFT_652511 [Colletotrichum sublineola]|nr:hypothetical protein LY78DRAFT_652511 [Colletotrichum sublineola]